MSVAVKHLCVSMYSMCVCVAVQTSESMYSIFTCLYVCVSEWVYEGI